MSNFEFYTPTHVYFGRDTQRQVGDLVRAQGCKKVLVHFGGQSARRSGLLDQIEASLDAAGVAHVQLGGVVPNPHLSLVYQGIDLCKKEGVDFILAVGGGSTIDSSKAIAAGSVYDGDYLDFYRGKEKITKALPIGTVLTIAAAGSEGSPNTVITDESTGLKKGSRGECLRPKFSIMDPTLTFTLPAYQTAAGATDIMAHICERYFSNTEGVEVTDRLCEGLLKTMIKEAPIAVKEPENYDARANIMWAGMLAHNNICGVGRVQDWASHHIEHELSAKYDVTHGAGLAVIMPKWMRYVLELNPDKLVQFAKRVWDVDESAGSDHDIALKGIEAFEHFLKEIGMPSNFEEIGAKKEDIPVMADQVLGSKKTEGNYIKLKREDIIKIYESAL